MQKAAAQKSAQLPFLHGAMYFLFYAFDKNNPASYTVP